MRLWVDTGKESGSVGSGTQAQQFPRPGGDAIGCCIELPPDNQVYKRCRRIVPAPLNSLLGWNKINEAR
jgi:hypothetical protein